MDVLNGTAWSGDAGALLAWARWHVDGLYYAADLDAVANQTPAGQLQTNPTHHAWEVVDLAHAKWAADSAATTWDLLAAGLARHLGIGPRTTKAGSVREFDLRDLEGEVTKGTVTGSPAAWATAVATDADVALLEAVRNPTTHSRLRRHFNRAAGSPAGQRDRTYLVVDGTAHHVSDLVLLARDTAARIVDDFLDRVVAGTL